MSAPGPRLSWWRAATSPSVMQTALRVSLVVGTLLNAVNLGSKLVHGIEDVGTLLRVLANYAVPYCVATVGAASQAVKHGRDLER